MSKINREEQLKIKKMEKVMKGSANHWRIAILFLLEKEPELTVMEVSETLGGSFVTIASHLQKMESSGLIYKNQRSTMVEHVLTPTGKEILKLLRII